MYKIIGADHKEYGPITAEQLRYWISEGRVNAQTQARADGTNDWKPLGQIPEFAEALGLDPVAVAAGNVPPAGYQNNDPGEEAARQAVKVPAIALIVISSIGILYYLFNAIYTFVAGGAMLQQEMPPNLPPQLRAFFEGMHGPLAGAISLLIVGLNVFMLLGAIKLLRLRNLGLVTAACVVAVLPCQCCCLFGLPFGIWALVVINKPEIKRWFR